MQNSKTPDHVNHPSHYGGDSTYEAVNVIEAWNLGWHLGSAVKYIARAGKKPNNPELQDLKKARWCIDRRIALLENPKNIPNRIMRSPYSHGLTFDEALKLMMDGKLIAHTHLEPNEHLYFSNGEVFYGHGGKASISFLAALPPQFYEVIKLDGEQALTPEQCTGVLQVAEPAPSQESTDLFTRDEAYKKMKQGHGVSNIEWDLNDFIYMIDDQVFDAKGGTVYPLAEDGYYIAGKHGSRMTFTWQQIRPIMIRTGKRVSNIEWAANSFMEYKNGRIVDESGDLILLHVFAETSQSFYIINP